MSALSLIQSELAAAKLKHPRFAHSLDQALAVLTSEVGELATAILRGDISGPHGVIREAAQVAAVAIRIIGKARGMGEVAAQTNDVRCGTCGWWKGGEVGFHIDEVRTCTAPVPASVACWGKLYTGGGMGKNDGKDCPCHKQEVQP